jgi:hypothetical protein
MKNESGHSTRTYDHQLNASIFNRYSIQLQFGKFIKYKHIDRYFDSLNIYLFCYNNIKIMKTIWYCPCECKTPKGMIKKFYKINNLVEHIISDHSDKMETKIMYRLKSDEISSTNKKRSHDEVEQDGFKELLSVEEEDEFRKSEEEITDLSNATASMDL